MGSNVGGALSTTDKGLRDWFLDLTDTEATPRLPTLEYLDRLPPLTDGRAPMNLYRHFETLRAVSSPLNSEPIQITPFGWDIRAELIDRRILSTLHRLGCEISKRNEIGRERFGSGFSALEFRQRLEAMNGLIEWADPGGRIFVPASTPSAIEGGPIRRLLTKVVSVIQLLPFSCSAPAQLRGKARHPHFALWVKS